MPALIGGIGAYSARLEKATRYAYEHLLLAHVLQMQTGAVPSEPFEDLTALFDEVRAQAAKVLGTTRIQK